jgi:hypothetical protein
MKNLFSYIYVPKKLITALVSVFAVVGIGAVAFAAYGPSRPTYTWANPADHITFNSITDNPTVGDERTFLEGAIVPAAWSDPVNGVKDGDVVALKLYFHNDAKASLGLVATNTTVKVVLPAGSAADQAVTGYVRADNATPVEVYDAVNISSLGGKSFTMAYIPGSAKLVNNVFPGPNGIVLSDSIVTTGALVGYDALNGRVPGCDQYSGWVYLKVRISVPNPAYSCNALTVTNLGGRQIKADVNTTATGGASLSTITYNFGDGSANLVTNDVSATHTYAQDGTFTVQAVPSFTIGGQTFTATSAGCAKQVRFGGEIPNTGPGSMLGIFAGTSVLGAIAYRLRTIRRLSR